jgi:hypothetical protein
MENSIKRSQDARIGKTVLLMILTLLSVRNRMAA